MKIEISNIEDCKSESVQLLTKIIQIEQEENDRLSNEVKKLNKKISKLEPIKNNYSVLENAKKALESQYTTLEEEKKALESQCSSLEEEKKALESQCSSLEEEKKALESQHSTLVLHDKLSTIQLVLTSVTSKLQDSQWKEFINAIITGIDNTISTLTTVDESLDKIQVKNGWLTKLASLHWWSKESHVKDFIPDVLNANSILHKIFDYFLEYLDANKVHISLPDVDFSSELDQYDADYDEDPKWIKVLFPQYQPKDYILCEICFLSINSRKGQCSGFNVK